MRAVWLLVAKDLRLFVRDPVALLLAVLLPIALVTVFGTIMSNVGGGGGGMPRVDVAVLDLDDSEDSRAFVAAFSDADGIEVDIPREENRSREALRRAVHDGDVPFVVILPEGFSQGAELELLRDPGRTVSQQILFIGLVRALIDARGPDIAWDIQTRTFRAAGIPEEWMGRIEAFTRPFAAAVEAMFEEADAAGYLDDAEGPGDDGDGGGGDFDMTRFVTEALPINATDVAPEGRDKQITYQVAHAVSGMTVMMLMFSLVGYARTLIEEREQGSLRRLLVAPMAPSTILWSKLLGTIILGQGLVLILFAYSQVVFGLDVVSRWDTLVMIALFTSVAVAGFALLVASFCKTDKQADGLSTIIILVMSSLGGAWMPLQMMGDLVQTVARFTIPYWSIHAFQRTFWNDQHWTSPAILTDLAVLAALGVGLSLLATRVFRRRYLAG